MPENATGLSSTQEQQHIIRYSTYQLIDDSFKTPIQPMATTLNTTDGLPMTVLGITALQIADFKFTHNFIICDRLTNPEIIFGIDLQKNSHYHMPRTKRRIATYRRMADFLYTLKTTNKR